MQFSSLSLTHKPHTLSLFPPIRSTFSPAHVLSFPLPLLSSSQLLWTYFELLRRPPSCPSTLGTSQPRHQLELLLTRIAQCSHIPHLQERHSVCSHPLREVCARAEWPRYVGTLVNINSEQSTVSLDNVRSYGTEGRRGGNDEYGPSDAVYEQIVFRGSDVKDLRIEETPKEEPPMPQDPAIIGVSHAPFRQDLGYND